MSDERASGWTDTLESKRESKLRWKQEVLDREEEKRQEIDKKEAEIRNKLRQQTIQKAKALQYEENERVRLLRSQQLYTDVIETRQQPLKEKKQLGEKLKEEALALLRIITPIMLELSHFRKPILKSLNLKD